MNDDFYIGYLARSPQRLGRHVRWIVAGTVFIALALIVGVAARQTPAEPGSFEFGTERYIQFYVTVASLGMSPA